MAANDAPALTVAVNATYQENAAAVSLSPALNLTDADDTELNFAAVQITAGSFPGDGDTLTVNGATSGTVTGITFTWNPTLHALVLTGASSVANYQALLQTVQFQSTSDNPTDFNASPQRTLTWLVSDGTAVTTATTTLDIIAGNDAPINTVPGAQSVAEDTTLPIAGVSVADIDSSALTTTLRRVERQAQCDRRRRRHRQRHRQRNHHRHGSADQHGAGGPRLYRQPRLQRRRHAHGRDQ